MIKSHEEQTLQTEIVVDAVICNCCGKPVLKAINLNGDPVINDHLHIDKAWDYFSSHDTEVHKFDICEDCYNEWIKSFKIPIEINNYM